jgi:hypothetical protein
MEYFPGIIVEYFYIPSGKPFAMIWPIDITKVPANRGLAITLFFASCFLPSFLYIRIFYPHFFLIHDIVRLSLLSLAAGFCLNMWFSATVMSAIVREVNTEKGWVATAIASSILTTFSIFTPVVMQVTGHKIKTVKHPGLIILSTALILSSYILISFFIEHWKFKRKAKNQADQADLPHPPQQTGDDK